MRHFKGLRLVEDIHPAKKHPFRCQTRACLIAQSQAVQVLIFPFDRNLDAQAAVNSIQRTKDKKPSGLRTAEMAFINGLTVKSPTSFTIKLSQPRTPSFTLPIVVSCQGGMSKSASRGSLTRPALAYFRQPL